MLGNPPFRLLQVSHEPPGYQTEGSEAEDDQRDRKVQDSHIELVALRFQNVRMFVAGGGELAGCRVIKDQ
jgi:hypothetical protein